MTWTTARPGADASALVGEPTVAAIVRGAPCTTSAGAWISARTTSAEVAEAIPLCPGCPMLGLWREVAARTHPTFGIWAGRRYGAPKCRRTS
ncbi:hypothetical protein [Cellulomonas sp. HZM]|uniref:hypothetical protein n=1 Tax=Cellulomonas sp. HZM TaxID=1454010 RepID=UPI0004935CED|nr:hypothetical protein [Cellulomonas sp. HZM]